MTTAAGIELKEPKHTRVVTLRNGMKAVTWLCLGVVLKQSSVSTLYDVPFRFPILGVAEDGCVHAWRNGGFWQESRQPHPLDIIDL